MEWNLNKLLQKCQEIKGKMLEEILDQQTIDNLKKTNKGGVGLLIEKEIFKLESGNQSIPDFENLGIELKSVPLKNSTKKKKDSIVYFPFLPKERVSLMQLNYDNVVKELNFYTSHLYKKCKNILFIFYLHDKDIKRVKIIDFYFYQLDNDGNIKQIENDYLTIVNKIKNGYAHQLSEGDTRLLGACTTGQGHGKDVKKQPFSNIEACARRFSFKTAQIRNILDWMNNKSSNNLFKDLNNRLSPYFNKPINQLMKEFQISKSDKSIKNKIICSILNVKNYAEYINKFSANKIMFKNIEYVNKKIKEEIGLIDVNFEEFKNDDINFNNSEFCNFISDLNIIFIVWEKIGENIILKGIKKLWLDDKYLEDAKYVWEHTKKLFLSSNCIKSKTDNKHEYNFIKILDNKTFHIRPHDQIRKDRYQMPNGEYLCKFQYWLNKNTIRY